MNTEQTSKSIFTSNFANYEFISKGKSTNKEQGMESF